MWAEALIAAGSCGIGMVAGYLFAISRTYRTVADLSPAELELLDRRVRARRMMMGTEQGEPR